MNKIRIIGGLYLILSIIGIFLYVILLLKFPLPTLIFTVFILVVFIFGIIGWVGFVMLKTPNLKD